MRRHAAVLAALCLAPALALAGERTLVVKTFEDDRFHADLATCQATGYSPLNVILGASVWSLRTHAKDGEVVNDAVRFLGTATGCGQMTSAVPYAAGQLFLIRFDLEDGSYVAKGTCDIASVTVPRVGIMLAGCALRIESGPAGVIGGIATSASVFNPYGLPGFGTGSIWTLHLYTAD